MGELVFESKRCKFNHFAPMPYHRLGGLQDDPTPIQTTSRSPNCLAHGSLPLFLFQLALGTGSERLSYLSLMLSPRMWLYFCSRVPHTHFLESHIHTALWITDPTPSLTSPAGGGDQTSPAEKSKSLWHAASFPNEVHFSCKMHLARGGILLAVLLMARAQQIPTTTPASQGRGRNMVEVMVTR